MFTTPEIKEVLSVEQIADILNANLTFKTKEYSMYSFVDNGKVVNIIIFDDEVSIFYEDAMDRALTMTLSNFEETFTEFIMG